ncbi:MAG: zinc ribbon domain-containing protein [Promethearchaeota archaeon]
MSEGEYAKGKKKARTIGKFLLVFGVILVIGGIISLIISFIVSPKVGMTPDDYTRAMELSGSLALLGMGLLAGGGFSVMIGIALLLWTRLGKITSYVAEEVSPAATKLTGAVVKGVQEGGGIKLQVDDASKQKIMIKCRYCGALNDEDDSFCSKCGQQL